MRRRPRPCSFLTTVAVLGGALCSAADARAAGVPVRIDSAEGNACGGAATIEAAMSARGVVISRRSDEATVASIRVASKGSGLEGSLILTRPSGRTARVVVAASCAEVLDAMAFTLALALEDGTPAPPPTTAAPSSAQNNPAPSSAQNNAPPSSAQNNAAPSSAQNNAAPSSALNNAPPSSALNNAPPSSALNNAPPSSVQNNAPPSSAPNNAAPPAKNRLAVPSRARVARALEFGVGVGAGLLAGVSPTPGATLGAWAMLGAQRTLWFAPALFGGLVIGLPADRAGALRATSALQAVTLDLCPTRFGRASLALWPCARVVAGRSQVRSEGFAGARLDERLFATFGVTARAEGRVAGPVFVHLDLALGVPVERATYFIGSSRLFETPAVSIGGTAGAGVHF